MKKYLDRLPKSTLSNGKRSDRSISHETQSSEPYAEDGGTYAKGSNTSKSGELGPSEPNGPFAQDGDVLENESDTSPALAEYQVALAIWQPRDYRDLPDCPPFVYGDPEHAEGWSLWWSALTRRNEIYKGNHDADV